MKNPLSISQRRSLLGKDICEHVLLVLAAILSDLSIQNEFEDLVAVMKPLLASTNSDCQWISDVSTNIHPSPYIQLTSAILFTIGNRICTDSDRL